MSRKTYFCMPDFDHPPDAQVQLGQIITSPRNPNQRLAGPLPIPARIGIQTNKKTDYHEIITRAQSHKIGLWVLFLASILGFGADVDAEWAVKNSRIMEFRELEATFFEPDDEYLRDSVEKSAKVKKHIHETPGKSLYMVTGVKVARGAKSIVRARKAVGVTAKLGVDASNFSGVPVQGGPAFKTENSKAEHFQFGGSSDFVYAYRLLRIIPKPRGVFKTKRFEKGAETLGNHAEFTEDVDRIDDDESSPREMIVKITDVELDTSDYGALPSTLPFDATSMLLDDELDDGECMCILPSADED